MKINRMAGRLGGWAIGRVGFATLTVLIVSSPPLLAQRCAREEQVGWIGIAGLQCSNCRIDSETMTFSTEPRITAVAPGSPASGVLRAGDVIVSVNGVLITTTEGGERLASVRPGQNLAMVVRRDGELITARLGTLPGRCRGDLPTAVPALAPTARAGAIGSGGGGSRATTVQG